MREVADSLMLLFAFQLAGKALTRMDTPSEFDQEGWLRTTHPVQPCIQQLPHEPQ